MEVSDFILKKKKGRNCYTIATVKSTRERLRINTHTNMLTLKHKLKCPVCQKQPHL